MKPQVVMKIRARSLKNSNGIVTNSRRIVRKLDQPVTINEWSVTTGIDY